MNSLILHKSIRRGSSNKKEQHYFDFLVSGQSLLKLLGVDSYDLITPVGTNMTTEFERNLVNEILLRKKSSLETGRIMLYVCPECADIDCGAITANIKDLGNKIVWKDFGYETGYGGVTGEYLNIDPIEFERQNYFKAFSILR